MIHKTIIIVLINIIISVLTCIVLKPNMFGRSVMHLPLGAFGSILLFKSQVHGLVYIYLITLYQCMEFYAHFKMYNIDYSWIDIEGYIVGFIYTTISFLYMQSDYKNNDLEF